MDLDGPRDSIAPASGTSRETDAALDSEIRRAVRAPAVDPGSFFAHAGLSQLGPGSRIDDTFVVERRLGRGGMGVVYLARHETLDRLVAVKVCTRRTSASDTARLLREARATAALVHPNIVVVHHVGTMHGQVYVVMEYLSGGTLGQWLRAQAHPWPAIVAKFCEAAEGLAAAHARGFVHRDFKPDNVLLGEDGRARVGDFGLVLGYDDDDDGTDADATLDDLPRRATSVAGTPRYMAPEQHTMGPLTPSADQFSLCVALYEALWGHHPFQGDTASEISASVRRGRRVTGGARHVPRRIRRAIERGLAVDPRQRHASMHALVEALTGRRRWPRLFGLLGVGAIAIGLAWSGGATPSGPSCRGPRPETPQWSRTDRTALREQLSESSLRDGRGLATRFETSIDTYLGRWADAERAVCAQASRIDDADLDRRRACLRAATTELHATVAAMLDADAATLSRGLELVQRLPDPSDCAALDPTWRAGALPSEDPRVGELLARSRIARDVGAYTRAREAADTLLALAPDGRAYAEGLHEHVMIAAEERDYTGVHQHGIPALRAAIEASAADLAASTSARLAFASSAGEGHTQRAQDWLDMAHTWASQAGEPPTLMAELELLQGIVHLNAHDDEAARVHLQAAREQAQALDPPSTTIEVSAMLNLGTCLTRADRPEAGLSILEEADHLVTATLGDAHPLHRTVLSQQVAVYHRLGKRQAALERSRASVERGIALYGADGPELANDWLNFGSLLLFAEGDHLQEAIDATTHAITSAKAAGHVKTVCSAMTNLGRLYILDGDLEQALHWAEQARAVAETMNDQTQQAVVELLVASIHVERGDADAATTTAQRAFDLAQTALGDNDPELFRYYLVLGDAAIVARDYARALHTSARTLALFPEDSPNIGRPVAQLRMAEALAGLDRPEEARRHVELAEPALATFDAVDVTTLLRLAKVRAALGDAAPFQATIAWIRADLVRRESADVAELDDIVLGTPLPRPGDPP